MKMLLQDHIFKRTFNLLLLPLTNVHIYASARSSAQRETALQ